MGWKCSTVHRSNGRTFRRNSEVAAEYYSKTDSSIADFDRASVSNNVPPKPVNFAFVSPESRLPSWVGYCTCVQWLESSIAIRVFQPTLTWNRISQRSLFCAMSHKTRSHVRRSTFLSPIIRFSVGFHDSSDTVCETERRILHRKSQVASPNQLMDGTGLSSTWPSLEQLYMSRKSVRCESKICYLASLLLLVYCSGPRGSRAC